jgi:glycosyltransferase involved in cell wall biosynthesis
MPENIQTAPWVSFCISTYKRPSFLRQQLTDLLAQTDPGFHIVISDNDPEGSAADIASSFNDTRIKYFKNDENLGMIRSFNKSIERAVTEYIVMVTDDDPVEKNFLEDFHKLINGFPGYSLYGGFIRYEKMAGDIEILEKEEFLREILDPARTITIFWSGCVLRRSVVVEIGKLPLYDGVHLTDHAMLAMTGSIGGGVVVNRMYSHMTFHENNFSKTRFDLYVQATKGFYETMINFIKEKNKPASDKKVIVRHLDKWFISNTFNLKKYYTLKKDPEMLKKISEFSEAIIAYPFMKATRVKYRLKNFVFYFKDKFHLLK